MMRHRAVGAVVPTWFLMALGVIALVFLTLFGIVRSLVPTNDGSTALPPPEPAFSLPSVPAAPQAPILVPTNAPPARESAVDISAGAPSPTASRTATKRPTAPPPASTRPAAGVTGHYSVFATFSDSFIGEVVLTNGTGRAQGWTATVSFPANVGTLSASWLEGLPQPTVKQNGRTYTWSSLQPLAPSSTGQLRFELKRTGKGDRANACVVNGAPCR